MINLTRVEGECIRTALNSTLELIKEGGEDDLVTIVDDVEDAYTIITAVLEYKNTEEDILDEVLSSDGC